MSGAKHIEGIFDLKGSMVNRFSKTKPDDKKTKTLKDKNLLKLCKTNKWLKFSNKDRKNILNSLKKDCAVLEKYNLMDYSLLLCIQHNPEYVKFMENTPEDTWICTKEIRQSFKETKTRYKFLSADGKMIYHIGVIDYLQDYNWDKWAENILKEKLQHKGNLISAVHPKRYAPRFLRFMDDYVILD